VVFGFYLWSFRVSSAKTSMKLLVLYVCEGRAPTADPGHTHVHESASGSIGYLGGEKHEGVFMG